MKKLSPYSEKEVLAAAEVFLLLIKWRNEEIAKGNWENILAQTAARNEKRRPADEPAELESHSVP